jgi:cysteine desulfurase/selenocysteine lyase
LSNREEDEMNSDRLETIRNDFPALNGRRKGKPPVYFDNACTTLVPNQVIDALTEYYTEYPACGEGRSQHWFAEEVSSRIEGKLGSRGKVADFINAESEKEIIFTSNTTHAINIVALGYHFKPGDVVLLGDKEHNSNLIPWLRLQRKGIIKVEHLNSNNEGDFNLEELDQKLQGGKVKLVSMGFTSNLTGCTIHAKEIVKLAHEHDAHVLLDGAQTVPHRIVDIQDIDADFLAFSIHKMCGPKGVGVLYGKEEHLGRKSTDDCKIEPSLIGGGTVADATYDSYRLLDTPEGFEAGVQNYPGQIGAGSAVDYLKSVGMDRVASHEVELNRYLTEELQLRYGDEGWFKILGPGDPSERGGIVTFEVARPNAVGIAEELSEKSNVMVRSGAFCVHSYLNREYGVGWAEPRLPSEHRMFYRASLYFYNTLEECQVFLDTLHEIFQERSYV